MGHRINTLGALILAGLTLTILMPGRSFAQSEPTTDWQKLSFVSFKHLADKSETTFDLQFETDSLLLSGRAGTFVNGFDSLHLNSFEVLANKKNLMKIEGYLINRQSQHKLKWTSAVNFTTRPKDVNLVNGSYIQFAAYNKLRDAERGLAFFSSFNLDIVYIGGMYKLVLPYNRNEFVKAREEYKGYDIWRVEYNGIKVIQAAQPDGSISMITGKQSHSVAKTTHE
ncbi:MAG: hypothetical protein RIM99_14095 [Cyclobacteriaceae bacterium]